MEDLYLQQLKQYLVVPLKENESIVEWTRDWGECNDQRTKYEPRLWSNVTCQIEGGTRYDWKLYPGGSNYQRSYLYCLQRLSERNYAMRAVVYSKKDSPCSARYTTWKHARFHKKTVSWLPPSTLCVVLSSCIEFVYRPQDFIHYIHNHKKSTST